MDETSEFESFLDGDAEEEESTGFFGGGDANGDAEFETFIDGNEAEVQARQREKTAREQKKASVETAQETYEADTGFIERGLNELSAGFNRGEADRAMSDVDVSNRAIERIQKNLDSVTPEMLAENPKLAARVAKDREDIEGHRARIERKSKESAIDRDVANMTPTSPVVAAMGSAGSIGEMFSMMGVAPVEALSALSLNSLGLAAKDIGTAAAATVASPVTGVLAAALGTGSTDFRATLADAAADAGYDLEDPADVQAFVEDEAVMEDVRSGAIKRGAVIGGASVATMGLGAMLANKGLKGLTAAAAGGVALEGGGEALGQIAMGDEVNSVDVAMEMLGSGPSTVAEVGMGAYGAYGADTSDGVDMDSQGANQEMFGPAPEKAHRETMDDIFRALDEEGLPEGAGTAPIRRPGESNVEPSMDAITPDRDGLVDAEEAFFAESTEAERVGTFDPDDADISQPEAWGLDGVEDAIDLSTDMDAFEERRVEKEMLDGVKAESDVIREKVDPNEWAKVQSDLERQVWADEEAKAYEEAKVAATVEDRKISEKFTEDAAREVDKGLTVADTMMPFDADENRATKSRLDEQVEARDPAVDFNRGSDLTAFELHKKEKADGRPESVNADFTTIPPDEVREREPKMPGRVSLPSGKSRAVGVEKAVLPKGTPERRDRKQQMRRERIAKMTPEEIQRELFTSPTGINNRRAFEEDLAQTDDVVSIDIDSLKSVNDYGSMDAGDEMLSEAAKAFKEVFQDDAYHVSGDEFYVLPNNMEQSELDSNMDKVREILSKVEIKAQKKGRELTVRGIDFSYGRAADKNSADGEMKNAKVAREKAGTRTLRGNLPKNFEYRTPDGKLLRARLNASDELVFDGAAEPESSGSNQPKVENNEDESSKSDESVPERRDSRRSEQEDDPASGSEDQTQPTEQLRVGEGQEDRDGLRPELSSEDKPNSKPKANPLRANSMSLSLADDTSDVTPGALRDEGVRRLREIAKESKGRVVAVGSDYKGVPGNIADVFRMLESIGKRANAIADKGRIYVVESQVSSPAEVNILVAHEGVHIAADSLAGRGHSMDDLAKKIFGKSSEREIRAMADRLGMDLDTYRSIYKAQGRERAGIFEELMAHMRQEHVAKANKNRFLKFYQKVREILAGYGITLPTSGTQLDKAINRELTNVMREWQRIQNSDRRLTAEQLEQTSFSLSLDLSPSTESFFQENDPGMARKIMNEIAVLFGDNHHAVGRLQTWIEQNKRGGKKLDESENAHNMHKVASSRIEADLKNLNAIFVRPATAILKKNNIATDRFDRFLHARHAAERNRVLKERLGEKTTENPSGMSDSDAAEFIGSIPPKELAQMEAAAQYVYDMLSASRQLALDSGMLDQSVFKTWDRDYEYYVPLKGRADDPMTGRKLTGGDTFGGRTVNSKRAWGRVNEADNILAQSALDVADMQQRARWNDVGVALLTLMENTPMPEVYMVRTEEKPAVERRGSGFVRKALGGMDQMVVMRDGKKHHLEVFDDQLAAALGSIQRGTTSWPAQMMRRAVRTLSMLFTTVSPPFAVANIARDSWTVVFKLNAERAKGGQLEGYEKGLTTKVLTKMFHPGRMADMAKLMWAIRDGRGDLANFKTEGNERRKMMKQWFVEGGKTSVLVSKDFEAYVNEIETLAGGTPGGWRGSKAVQNRAVQGALNTGLLFTDGLGTFTSTLENAARFAAYEIAIESGASTTEAAVVSKESTVNFDAQGQLGPSLATLYVFANATVQGTRNLLRIAGTPRGRRALGYLVAGSALSAAATREVFGEAEDGEDYYDKVPLYIKARAIVLPTATQLMAKANGTMDDLTDAERRDYVEVPFPYGLNIFKMAGDMFEDVANKADSPVLRRKALGDHAAEMVKAISSAAVPMGFSDAGTMSGTAVKTFAPSLLAPLADIALNENFAGATVYKEQMGYGPKIPESRNAKVSTATAYRAIAEALSTMTGGDEAMPGKIEVAPEAIKHMAEYYTGAIASFWATGVADTLDRTVGGVDGELKEMPFINRFAGDTKASADAFKFYDRADSIAQMRESLDLATLKGLYPERKEELDEKYGAVVDMADWADQVRTQLSQVWKERREIYANPDLAGIRNAGKRREALERMDARAARIVLPFNTFFNERIRD